MPRTLGSDILGRESSSASRKESTVNLSEKRANRVSDLEKEESSTHNMLMFIRYNLYSYVHGFLERKKLMYQQKRSGKAMPGLKRKELTIFTKKKTIFHFPLTSENIYRSVPFPFTSFNWPFRQPKTQRSQKEIKVKERICWKKLKLQAFNQYLFCGLQLLLEPSACY